jgi:hypothetical protein
MKEVNITRPNKSGTGRQGSVVGKATEKSSFHGISSSLEVIVDIVLVCRGAEWGQGIAVLHGKGFLEGLEGQTKPSVSYLGWLQHSSDQTHIGEVEIWNQWRSEELEKGVLSLFACMDNGVCMHARLFACLHSRI